MKIAVNGVSLLSPHTGIARYTNNLMREIEKSEEFELSFFYRTYWASGRANPAISNNIKSLDILRSQARRSVAAVPSLRRLAKHVQQLYFNRGVSQQQPDLYHDPNFIPFRFNGPIVTTIHDLSVIRYPETHPKARVQVVGQGLKSAVERSDIILTDSDYVAHEIENYFSVASGKIRPVALAADESFKPYETSVIDDFLRQKGLKYKQYLLAVGTLEPRKNLISLVRAFSKLPRSIRKQYPLIVAGMKGWRTKALSQEWHSLVSAGDIKLLGYVDDAQLPLVYAGATMLIYPSLYEGFGLPPLEAMACGTPVIVSNRSSLPEVVGDAGILVEPEAVEEIEESIMMLIQDAFLREQYSQRGLARAKNFSWARCAQETIAAYRQAINS